jgi:hypothetical protein
LRSQGGHTLRVWKNRVARPLAWAIQGRIPSQAAGPIQRIIQQARRRSHCAHRARANTRSSPTHASARAGSADVFGLPAASQPPPPPPTPPSRLNPRECCVCRAGPPALESTPAPASNERRAPGRRLPLRRGPLLGPTERESDRVQRRGEAWGKACS